MDFQVNALPQDTFAPLFLLNDAALAAQGIIRTVANAKPSFPCRVSLEDAEVGEELLLLPYQHLSMLTPYQSSGPIFVRKIGRTAQLAPNEIPSVLIHRLLSVRGYDRFGMMKSACVTEGSALKGVIHDFFRDTNIDFLHIHNAKPGCFSCAVTRVVDVRM